MEVEHLQSLIDNDVLTHRSAQITDKAWAMLKPTFTVGKDVNGNRTYSTFILEELNLCLNTGNQWFRKAVAIALTQTSKGTGIENEQTKPQERYGRGHDRDFHERRLQ